MTKSKFEKISSLHNSILVSNPNLELFGDHGKIALNTPDAKLLKCLDWMQHNNQDMIALGYSSGRALLGLLADDKINFVSEFLPRHSRSCVDVAFCANAKLLAAGMDKVRNDCGLNVWDIERFSFPTHNMDDNLMHVQNVQDVHCRNSDKPYASYGSSEGVSSMAWFNDSTTIVAGMSQKWIRIFDMRGICDYILKT